MAGDKLTLVFFVDALGWEIARELDCFRDVAPYSYRQRTVLGYSCAAQPTILTGLMPDEHGHWGMFYRTEHSQLGALRCLRFLPKAVSSHRRFRRPLLNYHRKRTGFTGYYNLYRIPFHLFSEFDLIEKRDIYAPGAFDSGAKSIFDHLADGGVPYRVWTWKDELHEGFAELEAAIRDDHKMRFALHYTPYIDAFLHGHIGDDKAVAGAVALIEKKIAHTVELARGTRGDVDLVIFSDHGMAETTGEHDVIKTVAGLDLRQGSDYQVFYDSTMARFWFGSSRARETITDALGELDCGTILSDDDLKREGVFFDDRRFGEVVFLMDPTKLIVPSYMGGKAPRGMHGFSPEHKDSYAMLAASFKIDPEPTHIRDSFRVMMQAAGLQTAAAPAEGGADSADSGEIVSDGNREASA
jgi:predicted AlkP superfamily pyrophosphatase or phosphodiesterase